MLTLDRLDVYTRQNGTDINGTLTPKQQRRALHKLRKGYETGGKVHRSPRRGERSAFLQAAKPAETLGDFGPVPEPAVIDNAAFDERTPDVEPLAGWEIELLNECPRCKATGDKPCVTTSGKATKTHKGRGE